MEPEKINIEENIDKDHESNTNSTDTPDEIEDETKLPEDNEIAKENMFSNLDEDASDIEDPTLRV